MNCKRTPVLVLFLSTAAFAQTTNPLFSTPWSRDFLRNAASPGALTDLGVSAYLQTLVDDTGPLGAAGTLQQNREYDVRWYGAVGDGVTDDTAAVQAAYTAAHNSNGGIVFFPPCTGGYLVSNVEIPYQDAYRGGAITSRGSGYASRLIAPTDANCLTVVGFNRSLTVFENMVFGSWDSVRDFNGVDIWAGKDNPALAGTSYCVFRECYFLGLRYAIRDGGDLYTSVRDCHFRSNVRDLYFQATAISHGGCLYVDNFDSFGATEASICLIGLPAVHMQQVQLRNLVIQGCAGFAVFARRLDVDYGLVIDSIYEESNGTGSGITIDGHTYGTMPSDRYDECGRVIWRNGDFHGDYDVNDTRLTVYDAHILGDPNVTGSQSLVNYSNCTGYTSGSVALNRYGEGLAYWSGVYGLAWRGPLTNNIAAGHTNLVTHGSCAIPFALTDDDGELYDFNSPGPIYDRCLQLHMHAGESVGGGDTQSPWAAWTTTAGKYYVASIDLRSADANEAAVSYWRGGGPFAGSMAITPGTWRRYWNLWGPTSTVANSMHLFNAGAAGLTVYVANLQCVEFNTRAEAEAYARSGLWAPEPDVPKLCLAPTALVNNYSVNVALDNGRSWTNAGAGGTVTIALPAATIGQRYGATRIASQALRLDPSGTETIQGDGAGHYLELDTNLDTVTLQCLVTGTWQIVAGYGTYAFE